MAALRKERAQAETRQQARAQHLTKRECARMRRQGSSAAAVTGVAASATSSLELRGASGNSVVDGESRVEKMANSQTVRKRRITVMTTSLGPG